MINELIRYSSVTTKARAMYGKCLDETLWVELADAESLRAVWEILRRSGAWAAAGEDPRCAEDPEVLIEALSRQLRSDCDRLCLYLKKDDQETLRYFLKSPFGGEKSPEEIRRWWKESAEKSPELRRIAGAEADALNLVYILRLRRFPGSVKDADALLIPVRHKLTADLCRRLLSAPNDKAVLEILQKTPWGGAFTRISPGELEKQYSVYMEAFCRRVLLSARPGLIEAQAFLTLKDMQRQRLARLIGAVSRRIDPHVAI